MKLPIIKSLVTYLEMLENPQLADITLEGFTLQHEQTPDVKTYIDLYREIGRDYIWNYRPSQTEEQIKEIVQSDKTRLYYLYKDGTPIGLAELDVTKSDDVEMVHFGLLPQYIGSGIGKQFLHKIIYLMWNTDIKRLWLSTCGLDHPKAIKFYENAGFNVFKTKEGTFEDYRYSGFYNMNDAAWIPHGTREEA